MVSIHHPGPVVSVLSALLPEVLEDLHKTDVMLHAQKTVMVFSFSQKINVFDFLSVFDMKKHYQLPSITRRPENISMNKPKSRLNVVMRLSVIYVSFWLTEEAL